MLGRFRLTFAARAALAALILLSAPLPAAAQSYGRQYRAPLDASTLRTAAVVPIRACAVEARRHCTGAPDVLLCLLSKPVISGPCAEALRDSSVLFDALDFCAADMDVFCGYVAPGRGAVMTCLADHYREISPDCYDSLDAGAEAYRANY